MNFLVLSLTCVFCKSAVCHRNLRMLAAAVSGTGLAAAVSQAEEARDLKRLD